MRTQTDRQQAIQWSRTMLALPSFLVLDTETTGLGGWDEIVSISIINGRGEILFDSLVKPSQPISSAAARVNGISNDDVRDAPTFADLYPQLVELARQQPLVAYNMDFDRRMLRQTCKQYDLPMLKHGESHCAMKWYARFYSASSYGYSARFQKLTSACYQLGIPVRGAHTAAGDCLMTLEIIHKMAAAI